MNASKLEELEPAARIILKRNPKKRFWNSCKKNGGTNKDLALRMGVKENTIKKWIYGQRTTPIWVILKAVSLGAELPENGSLKTKEHNWGQRKGGRKTVQKLLREHGKGELLRRSKLGGHATKRKWKKGKKLEISRNFPKMTMEEGNALLRGFADTDGNIHFHASRYGRITLTSKSKRLVNQFNEMLDERGFKCNKYLNKGTLVWRLCISGNEQVEKWVNEIGFNNLNHLTKYLCWKHFGSCKTDKDNPIENRIRLLELQVKTGL